MTLAALVVTLANYTENGGKKLPLWKMATVSMEELEARARSLVSRLSGVAGATVDIVRCRSVTGGGSLPGAEIDSWGVTLTHEERSTAEIERSLRYGVPPVIARIEDDRLILDLRTVASRDDDHLAALVGNALK
jgi:L-seryl-tRNA(Ser) seleniumtransferase